MSRELIMENTSLKNELTRLGEQNEKLREENAGLRVTTGIQQHNLKFHMSQDQKLRTALEKAREFFAEVTRIAAHEGMFDVAMAIYDEKISAVLGGNGE